MSQWIRASAAVVLAAGVAAGCGGSKSEQPAEQAAKSVEQAAGTAEQQMAKGFEAMAKGAQQMADAAKMEPVPPVSFRDLQALFPSVSGWEMGKPKGEKMTSPVSFSQSEVTYTQGEAEVDATITDSGFNQLLTAPFMMFMASGYERETDTGYEKSTTIKGQPGWEKWDAENKSGELNAFVAKRFVVKFAGRGISDTKVLHSMMEAVDFGKLAALK